jgi:hypothetical protein
MRIWLAALFLTAALPLSADATSCKNWSRLAGEQRTATVQQMIEERFASGRGKQWTSINRAAVHQCLMRAVPNIEIAFDGECQKRGGTRDLDAVLTSYIYSCVPR